jgi:cell division protein FtsL
MAGILVSTMLGLAYLTQTLGSGATSSEVRALEATARGLETKLSVLSVQAAKLTAADRVIASARKQGLRKLDAEIVLRAP